MQFQSFIRPLAIIFSVPLSIIGANILVNVTGVHFDSFTMLGYIMMVGLVVKNAIILITYAVQLENEGMDRDEALILASKRRMRPIFMTAIAMVLGMLPLAVKHGAGAEIYNGLGDGGGRRAFCCDTFHAGIHPGDLHYLGGCEGQILENSAYHVGRHKRRHSAQIDLIQLLFTLQQNDGWNQEFNINGISQS